MWVRFNYDLLAIRMPTAVKSRVHIEILRCLLFVSLWPIQACDKIPNVLGRSSAASIGIFLPGIDKSADSTLQFFLEDPPQSPATDTSPTFKLEGNLARAGT